MELDLTEEVNYKILIDFIVQQEIVHGLKYVHKTYRLGVSAKKVVAEFLIHKCLRLHEFTVEFCYSCCQL
ncbi:hypothetical protein TSAR_012376 [Trichomalopsis sarcophagae]|uniref:Uncharacterized protein n=1 Tax=Trichomalopsis sarcophagae TaxID=543379 RepID=A0A232EJH3_9HYME|nr:hypothetical protein TSAR_012376 [Trichomalopsis sarcophagae]